MILEIYKIRLLYYYNIYDDNIIQLIIKENKYILRDFFDTYKDKLNVKYLSSNCNALDLLLQPEYIKKISIDRLCKVEAPNLSKTLFSLYYSGNYDFKVFHRNRASLSSNCYAVDFITEYPRCINYDCLATNKMAKDLLLYIISTDKELYGTFYIELFKNPSMIRYLVDNVDNIKSNRDHPFLFMLSITYNISQNENYAEFLKLKNINFKNIFDGVENINFEDLLNNYIDFRMLVLNKDIYNIVETCKIDIITYFHKFINSDSISNIRKDIGNCNIWNKISEKCVHLEFLTYYQDKLNFQLLSLNENAIEILKDNIDKIDWKNLSLNINAIELLKDNIDKIDWNNLSLNINAIELLKDNIDKINYENLALNVNAIELLKTYIKSNKKCSKTFWNNLSTNPSIFMYF